MESTIPNVLSIDGGGQQGGVSWQVKRPRHRTYDILFRIDFRTAEPAQTSVQRRFVLEVPLDAGADDELFIQNMDDPTCHFGARMRDIWPGIRDFIHMRLIIFADRIIGDGLNALHSHVRDNLRPPTT